MRARWRWAHSGFAAAPQFRERGGAASGAGRGRIGLPGDRLENASSSLVIRFSLRLPRRQKYAPRSEEHTSELQSLMRISYAVFCLKKKIYIYYTQID